MQSIEIHLNTFLSQGKRKVNKHFEKNLNSFIVDFELLFSVEYATIREKL